MQFIQLVISGIAQGCIYGLIALGFVLIYKATETVSFAQGELMMLGAFLGLAGMSMLGFPFWLAVLASIAAMSLFGVLLWNEAHDRTTWLAIGLIVLSGLAATYFSPAAAGTPAPPRAKATASDRLPGD